MCTWVSARTNVRIQGLLKLHWRLIYVIGRRESQACKDYIHLRGKTVKCFLLRVLGGNLFHQLDGFIHT